MLKIKQYYIIILDVCFFVLVIFLIIYLGFKYIYFPYFTTQGKIQRSVNEELMLEKKVLYYACALPEYHRYHIMVAKECEELKAK